MKCYNIKDKHKRHSAEKMKRMTCAIDWDKKSVEKDGKGNIFIQGFANTSDKDRVDDIILPSAFEKTMSEFMENPVLLFQHDWDKIIGKVIEFKIINDENAERKGLWVKAMISKAKDVEDVRTKIDEGALKTFSIGYNELDADWDKGEAVNIVKEIELLEISVVTIPCNPFAKFEPTEGEKGDDKSDVSMSDDFKTFLCEAMNQLSSDEKIDPGFVSELVEIYQESKKEQ